jgi:hypothetical protein
MMLDPTTTASKSAVPSPLATMCLASVIACILRSTSSYCRLQDASSRESCVRAVKATTAYLFSMSVPLSILYFKYNQLRARRHTHSGLDSKCFEF